MGGLLVPHVRMDESSYGGKFTSEIRGEALCMQGEGEGHSGGRKNGKSPKKP